MTFNGSAYEIERTIAAGETLVLALPQSTPVAIAVHPAPGASASLSVSLSSQARIKDGSARWLPAVEISEPYANENTSPVNGIKITATGGAVVLEVLQ